MAEHAGQLVEVQIAGDDGLQPGVVPPAEHTVQQLGRPIDLLVVVALVAFDANVVECQHVVFAERLDDLRLRDAVLVQAVVRGADVRQQDVDLDEVGILALGNRILDQPGGQAAAEEGASLRPLRRPTKTD